MSVAASWATNVYGGLCTHPITGQVQTATGDPASIVGGGLAPLNAYPPCPIQAPPAPPTVQQAISNNPPLDAQVQAWPASADTPTVTASPSFDPTLPTMPQAPGKAWVPWAIGGGVVAALGAVIFGVLHR